MNLLPDDQSNYIVSSRNCLFPFGSVFFVCEILQLTKEEGLRSVPQSETLKIVCHLVHLLICQLLGKNPNSFAIDFHASAFKSALRY